MVKNSEKRKARRHNCRVPVTSKKGTAFEDSQTVDISKSGVGLICQQEIPIDTQMPIELALNPEGESVTAIGKVKWISRMPGADAFRIGVTFAEFISGSKSLLGQYISK